MSVSCALLATSLHQWARRYIRLSQPTRCSPEKRARMRALFFNGADKMHITWAVEGLPTLLHLSLFLFFGGVVIFLFNVDHEVFTCVVSWIGLFSMLYGLITLLPLIRQDSPYYAPLSTPVWFLYASIQYVSFKLLTLIFARHYFSDDIWKRCFLLRDRFRGWMLGGVEKKAEEMALGRSSEIDVQILGWTISALGNDDSLEKFFETIPGLFNSRLVKDLERHFPEKLLITFWHTLDGLMCRTLSSNSVTESVKSRRVSICRDIMSTIPCHEFYANEHLRPLFSQAPVSIEKLQAMARWFTHMSPDVSCIARIRVARNLPRIQERDNRWLALASAVYSLSEHDLQRHVAFCGDDVLLATLIDFSRRAIHFRWQDLIRLPTLVVALSQFDVHQTHPGLRHEFCTFWNELVQETRNQANEEFNGNAVCIVFVLRSLYLALHRGTGAAQPSPAAFSPYTHHLGRFLYQPPSYPLCDIASHRPDSTAPISVPLVKEHDDLLAASYYFTSGGSPVSQQVKEASIIAPGLSLSSDPTTPDEAGGDYQAPVATSPALPVHTSTNTSPRGSAAISLRLQGISTVATLSHPLEGTTQWDEASPPDITEILIIELMPPTFPASTPFVLYKSPASCDAGAGPISNPLVSDPTSTIFGFSVLTSSSLSRVPPFPNAASLIILGDIKPSRPTSNITPKRLHTRGLVNTGNMCLANSVLQLLLHVPPFWNLFKELGRLKGPRGARGPETAGGATPLVDATVRLVEELMPEEKEPLSTRQPPELEHAEIGRPRADEEEKTENKPVDSFEPTYMYDAMKENGQLKTMLVRSPVQDASFRY